MASFVRNIHTKNYQDLVADFHVTIENVSDVFLGNSGVSVLLSGILQVKICQPKKTVGSTKSCISTSEFFFLFAFKLHCKNTAFDIW